MNLSFYEMSESQPALMHFQIPTPCVPLAEFDV